VMVMCDNFPENEGSMEENMVRKSLKRLRSYRCLSRKSLFSGKLFRMWPRSPYRRFRNGCGR
jgi:hypothetical protein